MTTTNAVSIQSALTHVTERLRRSTVQVRGRHNGMGSGVIWSPDGVIVSNAHVVSGRRADIELHDGRTLPATLTARNAQRDLVALKVEATDLPAAEISDSEALRVGELVLAIGNPYGLTGALTTGIVHTLAGSHQAWIQADILLAPGNSGGPLANAQGQVIGINTMIVNGRGFAVPSSVVQQFLGDRGDRPYLGVTLQPVRLRLDRRTRVGWLVTDVEVGSPAAAAQLQLGDVLVGSRGLLFQQPNELFHILTHSNEGDGLRLEIVRGDRRVNADVVLWNRPSETKAA